MSYTTDLLTWCRANPAHTIADALSLNNYLETKTRLRIRAKLRERLVVGGTDRELVEKRIIIPGPEDAHEAWAQGQEIGTSKLPAARRGLPLLHARDTSRLPTAAAAAVSKIAELSLGIRSGGTVSDGVLVISDSLEDKERTLLIALDHIETLKHHIEAQNRKIAELERQELLAGPRSAMTG